MKKIALIAAGLLTLNVLHAQLRLPKLIGDSMVLQRDKPLLIWGWDRPGKVVTVSFRGRRYTSAADGSGKWTVNLPAQKAGGPFVMDIAGSTQQQVKEILVGDVWICSGQSNMQHSLGLHRERYAAEIDQSVNPSIRQFLVPVEAALEGTRPDLGGGTWKGANPANLLQFSAVGYFFARKLQETYKIPIGIINTSAGGSPAEAWMSDQALRPFPDLAEVVGKNKELEYVAGRLRADSLYQAGLSQPADQGLTGSVRWYDPKYEPKGWRPMMVPGYWEDAGLGYLDGIVWYRKEFIVPASLAASASTLVLGRIVDTDETYVNGQLVGRTGYQYPQRRYHLPAGVLKEGRNVLTVRITNRNNKGGFVPDKPYFLASGKDTIDLRGEWLTQVGGIYTPAPPHAFFTRIYQPAALYNAMIYPLLPYGIKGFAWYQGESNIQNASMYQPYLTALIRDWRAAWKDSTLPFVLAQLPNHEPLSYGVTESGWARLREEQRKTLALPNTAMAVTIDLGEWNDIHPGRKKEVGERMALAVQPVAYGQKEDRYNSPQPAVVLAEGRELKVVFRFTAGGVRTLRGGSPGAVAIAGPDRVYRMASTALRGDTLIAWSDQVRYPVSIRYAWADNPYQANLYNSLGLPASPFEAAVVRDRGTGLPWNGHEAAVVLTYDDALNVHISHALPALDARGLKATFYLSDYFGGLKKQIPTWKRAASTGHELGNHTVFHPCEGGRPGREFVQPEYDLRSYTLKRIGDEVQAMNTLLFSIDGREKRTFAFPCSDTRIRDTLYLQGMYRAFSGAREVRNEMPTIDQVDTDHLPAYMIHGQTGEELIKLVREARQKKGLLVFLFHGVGGEHGLNVSLEAHSQLLQYLQENRDSLWIAPMQEVADYISTHKKKPNEEKR